ncbi:MAG: tyrosine-type recombinase/integrase [Candidatus Eisenbacteria bacterium]
MPIPSPYPNVPKYLSQDEVRGLFRVITEIRDRALFSLLYLYGLRVSEVSLLGIADVDLDRHRILIRRVKSGVWGEKPLFRSTERMLLRYLEERNGTSSPALFPGRGGGPLGKRRVQELFTKYREEAGLLETATCHSLRHSIATHLLDAGLPLAFVQDHLGHKNPASTAIYARISDPARTAFFRRLESSPWVVQPETAVTHTLPTEKEEEP